MLTLMLNELYIDANGNKVTLVKFYTEEDPDFHRGFAWRGDNGYSYTATGDIVSSLGTEGRDEIVQMGATPLVAIASAEVLALPTFSVQVGSYYRNGIGAIVQLASEVDPSTNRFKDGYRFRDHRGTYYTETGSTKSWLFKSLNLKSEVFAEEVTAIELATIVEQERVATCWNNSTSNKVLKASAGVATGVGVIAGVGFLKLGVTAARVAARA